MLLMTRILTRLFVTAFALILVAEFIPGIEVDSVVTALIAAILLGVVNALVRPLLVILTLPITLITLGLFILVINAFLFWGVASFLDGFTVSGFWPALFGSIIVSIVSAFVNKNIDD
jgi:putative membrane protein